MSDNTTITLDLTASFANVIQPTPFGTYDADAQFQTEANGLVKLAYRRLGGSVLQVELTNKDIYACLEDAVLEFSSLMNAYHAKSVMVSLIGFPTRFFIRLAE